MKTIEIFTDGSTLNNYSSKGDRKGGVGVFFGDKDIRNISKPLKETGRFKVTNNVAEIIACIDAIQTILSTQKIIGKQIIIYTDSNYVKKSMSQWGSIWEKNNWKKANGKMVDNLNLIKKLYYLSKNIGVIFRHCNSHQKEPSKDSKEYHIWYGNNQADKLAVNGAKKVQ